MKSEDEKTWARVYDSLSLLIRELDLVDQALDRRLIEIEAELAGLREAEQ